MVKRKTRAPVDSTKPSWSVSVGCSRLPTLSAGLPVPRHARATLAALTIAAAIFASLAIPAAAQPDPATCTVEPRSIDEISLLAAEISRPTPPITEDGTPAGSDIVTGVTATIEESVACTNANDPLRVFALFTDRYVGERFGLAHPDDLGSLTAALSRTPVPADDADRLAIIEIRDIESLGDHRTSAAVVTESRSARFVDRLTFEFVADRWLIDSWEPLAENGTPVA